MYRAFSGTPPRNTPHMSYRLPLWVFVVWYGEYVWFVSEGLLFHAFSVYMFELCV